MPLADPRAYKTFSIHQPLSTHFRPATCAEADCPYWLHGWKVRRELLDAEALHIIATCGRRYRLLEVRQGESYFEFEPGQPCLKASEHRAPVGRPELYVIRDGNARGNPTGRRDLVSAQTWSDNFGEHQDRLAAEQQKG